MIAILACARFVVIESVDRLFINTGIITEICISMVLCGGENRGTNAR